MTSDTIHQWQQVAPDMVICVRCRAYSGQVTGLPLGGCVGSREERIAQLERDLAAARAEAARLREALQAVAEEPEKYQLPAFVQRLILAALEER